MGRRSFLRRLASVLISSALLSAGLAALPPSPALAKRANDDPKEVEELRTETSETFLNEDGSFTTTYYSEPIHYADDKGDWQPIGEDLVPSEEAGYAWSNGANSFEAEFKATLVEDFLRLDVAGQAFTLTLEGAAPSPGTAEGRTVSYPGAFPGVDLAYDALPEGLQKTLVLASADVPTTYRFLMSPPEGSKVVTEEQKDGGWAIRLAPEAEPAFVLSPPRASEAGDIFTEDPEGDPHASMAVTEVEGKWAIDLSVDEAWLKDPARTFPVNLDPTVTFQPPAEDASFSALCPTCLPTTADHLYVGTTATEAWRGAIKFSLSLPPGSTISDAKLRLYFDARCLAGGSGFCGGTAHDLDVHPMTAAWSTSSTTSQIAFDPVASAAFTLPTNPALQWMNWNLTPLVQSWYSGSQANYGVLVKRRTEPLNSSGPTPVGKRYSGEPALRPKLDVTFTAETSYLYAPQTLHSNGAELVWSPYAGTAPFSKWEVHRGTTPSFTPSATTLLTTIKDVEVTSYTDTTAKAGAAFTYKVLANSSASNGQTVTLPTAGRGSKTLQPDPALGEATYLRFFNGYTACDNLGAASTLKVGAEASEKFRPVISFDLRDIPVGSSITTAQLKMWTDKPPGIPATVEVHRLKRDWREGTGTAACTGDGATWYDTEAGILWTAPGGDFDSVVETSVAATPSTDPVWHTFSITSLVQKWVNGDAPNHGMLLRFAAGDETFGSGRSFSYASDDYADSTALRPKLIIDYADGSTVVVPTTSLASHGANSLLSGTVTLKAAAADDRRVDQVEFIRVDQGQDLVMYTATSAPFTYDWNTAGVSNGNHTIKTRATDDAGNVTTSSGVSVTVHNSAMPTASITAPSPSPPNPPVSGTVAVTADAADPPAPPDGIAKVEFYADGVAFGEDTSAPYTKNWNTLDAILPAYDGTHELTVKAYSNSGQQVTTSAPVTVTVNNIGTSMYKATFGMGVNAVPVTVTYDPAAQTQLLYPVAITVTNTSEVDWTAGRVALKCRWYAPGAPRFSQGPHPLVTPACPDVTLPFVAKLVGTTLATVQVSPPTLTDGVNRSSYRLQFDLFDTNQQTQTYFAPKGNAPSDNEVRVNKKVATEALGLERYFHYTGADLGAGWEHLFNVATGNSVIRWTPFVSKGRGLSTVVSLTYNSLEEHSWSPAGNNFSLSISSLIPMGTCVDIHPNPSDLLAGRTSQYIEFTDADGTTHRFNESGTPDVYTEPAGVNLFLRKLPPGEDGDYAITRPDQVTFFFNNDGYPTVVRDRNGNEISFELENAPSGHCPGAQKQRIKKVKDPSGPNRFFEIQYYSNNDIKNGRLKGHIEWIKDHGGHKLIFQYYEDGNLLRLTQEGGTNPDGTLLPDRSFVFTYMHSENAAPAIPSADERVDPYPKTSPQSSQIFSIRDARGKETTFRYCFPAQGPYACGTGPGEPAKNKGKLKYRFDRPGEGDEEPDPPGEIEPPFTEFAYDIGLVPPKTTVKAPAAPDPRNTEFRYTAGGQVETIVDPLGQSTAITWTPDLQVDVLDEPGKPLVDYAYNPNGYLTSRMVKVDEVGGNPVWSETQLEYDNVDALPEPPEDPAEHVSLLRKKTDPRGVETSPPIDDYQWEFTYYTNGNLQDVFSPEKDPNTQLRYVTHYDWNTDGSLLRITDARQTKTEFTTYHVSGQPTTVVEAVGLAEQRTTTLGYDADGQLIWIQDPEHLDESGSDEREYKSFFDYDNFHRLGRQSTPKSTEFDRGDLIWTTTRYDPNDNVTDVIAPAYGDEDPGTGSLTTLAYSDMDRLTLVTGPDKSDDPDGERTKWDYDNAGRITQVTLPKGMKSSAANDFIIRYDYDKLDRVLRQIRYDPDPTGTAFRTHYCYDPSGDLISVTAPRADVSQVTCPTSFDFTTKYEYFFDHALKKETLPDTDDYPLGVSRIYAYDLNRNLQTITNENLDVETRAYDQRNLLVSVVQPFNVPTPGRYITTKFEYDGVGNRTKVISPRAFDAAGGGTPVDFVTSYDYDKLNRMTKVFLPKQGTDPQLFVYHGYDLNGNIDCTSVAVATVTTCQGVGAAFKTTMKHFDPGWIYSSKDPGIPKARFDYTAEGRQSSRFPVGFPREEVLWAYFADGMLKEVHDQDDRPATYDYDSNNNLELARDETGVIGDEGSIIRVKPEYDGLDRITKAKLKKETEQNWRVTKFSYDLNSNIRTREDNRVEDDQGVQVTAGRTQTFSYDEADWLIDQIDDYGTPDPNDCTDNRKVANEFWAPGWEKHRELHRAGPDCVSNPLHWQLKLTKDWDFFDNGKLKSVITKKNTGTPVEQHDVDYIQAGIYVNGHRVRDAFTLVGPDPGAPCDQPANNCNTVYHYDARDRLKRETRSRDGNTTDTFYTLDNAGNLEQIQAPTFTRTMTYIGNRINTVTESGQTKKYHYDSDGNLDCITNLSGAPGDCPAPTGMTPSVNLVADYAYDYLNRLTSYRFFNPPQTVEDEALYEHDALDRVVTETEKHPPAGDPNDRKTEFSYLGLTNKVTQEIQKKLVDQQIITTKTYNHDAYGNRLGMRNDPAPEGEPTKDYSYSNDVHGSVSLLVDEETNSPFASYAYSPFGEEDTELSRSDLKDDDLLNPYRYASKRLDSGSDSYDMGARRFGPDVAHFLQQDLFMGALDNLGLALDPLTQNRYALAGGNPMSFIEWDGHVFLKDGDAGGAKEPSSALGVQISVTAAAQGLANSFAGDSSLSQIGGFFKGFFWSGPKKLLGGMLNVGRGVLNSTIAGLSDPETFKEQWRSNFAALGGIARDPKAAISNFTVGPVVEVINTVSDACEQGNCAEGVGEAAFDICVYACTAGAGRVAWAATTRGVSRALPFADDVMRSNVRQALDDLAAGVQRRKNDFEVFENRPNSQGRRVLPKQPYGYYREYGVRPPSGTSGAGTWRIVFGQGGEFYFTPNHYENFVRF